MKKLLFVLAALLAVAGAHSPAFAVEQQQPLTLTTPGQSTGPVVIRGVGLANPIARSVSPTIACRVTGTVNYSEEFTLESPALDATSTWFPIDNGTSLTASANNILLGAVSAVHILYNSGTGTLVCEVAQ